jgi:hypothetical protein
VEEINCINYIVNRINYTVNYLGLHYWVEETWSKIKPNVSHFCVFGSEVWAHIPNDKRKTLQPKSEKWFFFGYSKKFKGYIILQPHSNKIIIRRDFNFDENLLAYQPSLAFVPSSTCKPYSTFVSSSIPILVYIMTLRMKMHLGLLTFLKMIPLNMNMH